MSRASPPHGRFGSPLVDHIERFTDQADVSVLTSYPPAWEHAGGGSFVDRSLLHSLPGEVRHLSVTNRLSTDAPPETAFEALSSVPLQIRRSRRALAGVAARVATHREPYGVAKFRSFSRQWEAAQLALTAADPQRLVCTSFVPLLLAYDAKVPIDSYLAFNVEWELSRRHAPRVLGRDYVRHREVELTMMDTVSNLFAVSHADAATLSSHLGRPVQPLMWDYLPSPLDASDAGRSERPMLRLGILGSYSWPPNAEDMSMLIHTIAPRLRQEGIPAEVVVAGAGTEVLSGPHVSGLGRIDNVDDFYDAVDIVVVPRTEATGISVKVVEARLKGKAIVTTRSVAAALGASDGLILADSAEDMVDALVAVHER